jgi:signal transduction histidine kinase
MTENRFGPPPLVALPDPERRLLELEFLHEFAQLAAQARDWDELMRTIIERTTVALRVDVCSLYLMDRDGDRLTLAATNGLDPNHVGKVSLAFGEGITGNAAKRREPIQVPDVRLDPRFKWVRGYDLQGITSMLSVPLTWNDRVVGVINTQTRASRNFAAEEIEFLVTIAALLGGIVEKGRLQTERERQLEALTALDVARAELLSLVTHELRTPLSVVRAYLDLLGDAAQGLGDPPPRASAEEWRTAAIEQVARLDGLVDSILVAVRRDGVGTLQREPFDVSAVIREAIAELAPLFRAHRLRFVQQDSVLAIGDRMQFRQVLEHLLENESKYTPPAGGVSVGAWREGDEVRVWITDEGPGIPIDQWERVFDAFVRVDGTRSRGSGIGLFAARRLMEAMGGRVWLEANGYGGSRFVLALPAADAATQIGTGLAHPSSTADALERTEPIEPNEPARPIEPNEPIAPRAQPVR